MSPRRNTHAVALGRKGGKVTSDAKAEAARRNGAKGGRRPAGITADVTQRIEHAMARIDQRLAVLEKADHTILLALRLGLQYANLYSPPEETGNEGTQEHQRDLHVILEAIQVAGGGVR